jgi:GTP-binding protein
MKSDGTVKKMKIKELQTFEGLGRAKAEEVSSGEICAMMGIDDFEIGDTISILKFKRHCHVSRLMNQQ